MRCQSSKPDSGPAWARHPSHTKNELGHQLEDDMNPTLSRKLSELNTRTIANTRAAAISLDLGDFVECIVADINGHPPLDNAARSRVTAATSASTRIEKESGVTARGQWIPIEVLSRGLNIATPGAGKELTLPRGDGRLIESLRPYSGVLAAGAVPVFGLQQGDLVLPRTAGGASVQWVGEGGSAAEGDPMFGQVVASPRTVAATVRFSRQLAKTASFRDRIESLIAGELMSALWSEIDRVAMSATGSATQPTGLLGNADVLEIEAGTDGAPPSIELLTDIEEALGLASGRTPNALFATPQIRRKMRLTARNAALPIPLWGDDNRVIGIIENATTHLPSDGTKGSGTALSTMVVGDFTQMLIPVWGPAAIDVTVNPFLSNGQVEVTALVDVSVGLRHPQAFARCVDVATE